MTTPEARPNEYLVLTERAFIFSSGILVDTSVLCAALAATSTPGHDIYGWIGSAAIVVVSSLTAVGIHKAPDIVKREERAEAMSRLKRVVLNKPQ